MYKIQVFYDKDCAEAAARIAAYRMDMTQEFVASLWEDRRYFCKSIEGKPVMILQPIELIDLEEMEDEEDIEEDTTATEVYDADEVWVPLGWSPADIAMIRMSNIYELGGCGKYLELYFYC